MKISSWNQWVIYTVIIIIAWMIGPHPQGLNSVLLFLRPFSYDFCLIKEQKF